MIYLVVLLHIKNEIRGRAMAKKRIAVLFGGASADHAASLHTAYSVLSSLPKEIEPLAIGITRAGRWLFIPVAMRI